MGETQVNASRLHAGHIVQIVEDTLDTYTAAVAAANTTLDDSIPSITEGVECNSLVITPQFSDSKIFLMWTPGLWSVGSSGGWYGLGAFYRNGATNAIHAGLVQYSPGTYTPLGGSLIAWDSPASTSATTYTTRMSSNGNIGIQYNGTSSRWFGGASKCTLTAMEIKQ